MSAGIIVVIIVVIVVVAALVAGRMVVARRRRLQQRFGPEYDRLVSERDSKRQAEAELTERERRVQDLDIRPLTESARARYAREWATLQEQFVDTPADAVAASQVLVGTVMNERGYPTDNRDQVLADLSVEHAKTLDHYRAAEEISESATAGTASTEDLRQAMIHYRALFRELLGESVDAGTGPDATSPARDAVAADQVADDRVADDRVEGDRVTGDRVTGDRVAGDRVMEDPVPADPASRAPAAADGQADETRRPMTADEPASNGRADNPVQHTPRS